MKAFSLLETVISILVLSIVLGTVSFLLVQGNHQLVSSREMNNALTLGSLYLEEVIATGRWDELTGRQSFNGTAIPVSAATIGPEENTRAQYDDCDDYDGFIAQNEHMLKNNTPLDNKYNLFTVRIDVDFVNFADPLPVASNTNYKKVTVQVSWRDNNKTKLDAILANL